MSNKITFGICTFNRKEVLEKSVKSLLQVKGIENINIRIYDDCSSEYDEQFLRDLIPNAASITRQKKNLGADRNTSLMYEDFLRSDDDWLFNADSDLIYRTDLIEMMNRYSFECDGFMTFYNSLNHKNINCSKFDLVIKDEVGAAGCFIRRDVVEYILKETKLKSYGFDVRFSKILKNSGMKIYASTNSYVQHIGLNGYNSRSIVFDYGINFLCDSLDNANAIELTFENYIALVTKFRSTYYWKMYNFVKSISRRVKKIIKVIIDNKLS